MLRRGGKNDGIVQVGAAGALFIVTVELMVDSCGVGAGTFEEEGPPGGGRGPLEAPGGRSVPLIFVRRRRLGGLGREKALPLAVPRKRGDSETTLRIE